MTYKKKYSVFISSTYEDLRAERQVVMGVALDNSIIPVGMEQFHAVPTDQWNVITKMIAECDGYLLIIGGRYGSIDDATGISYTEREYNYARERGLPISVLIYKPSAITADRMDIDDVKHNKYEKQQKLEEFKNKVKNDGNTVDFFGSIDELKYITGQAFNNLVDYFPKDSGWVRFSDMPRIINDTFEKHNNEIKEQQEIKINAMEATLTQLSVQLTEVKDIQRTMTSFEPISKDDIDKMFTVEGENLNISVSKQ